MSKRGTLYCGDCLQVLEERLEPESVDLIYLDPPFFSNRNYEVIWGDECEKRSFDDRWEGGIEVYVAWMGERLRACHRVLKPTGSIYLHCDWHASHYLKVRMDEIFGIKNFLNNCVWIYGLGGSSKRYWPRKHDEILWYSKMPDKHFFDPPMVEATSNAMKGKLKKMLDSWDIPAINNMAKERLGYPTQKPEALLDLIITSSSRPTDVVLDPFCGCGTTMAVAHRLGRPWIGIDISPTAVKTVLNRVKPGPDEVAVVGMPTSIPELRALKPFEFQNWVVRERFNGTLGPKGGDKGIDGFTFMLHEPIQVKQSEGIGRNVVDNFASAMRRVDKKKGYIVAFSFGKGAIEEVACLRHREGLEIVLVTVGEIVDAKFARE
jgi:DNA modification methylase